MRNNKRAGGEIIDSPWSDGVGTMISSVPAIVGANPTQPAILILAFMLFTLTAQAGYSLSLGHKGGDYFSEHFTKQEFACKHCGKVIINPDLVKKLECLRTSLGDKPIVITSGYRCPKHNKAVGGVKNSQHLKGNACDIQVKGISPSKVAKTAKELGLFTIIYPTWTHIDLRNTK